MLRHANDTATLTNIRQLRHSQLKQQNSKK